MTTGLPRRALAVTVASGAAALLASCTTVLMLARPPAPAPPASVPAATSAAPAPFPSSVPAGSLKVPGCSAAAAPARALTGVRTVMTSVPPALWGDHLAGRTVGLRQRQPRGHRAPADRPRRWRWNPYRCPAASGPGEALTPDGRYLLVAATVKPPCSAWPGSSPVPPKRSWEACPHPAGPSRWPPQPAALRVHLAGRYRRRSGLGPGPGPVGGFPGHGESPSDGYRPRSRRWVRRSRRTVAGCT